MRATGKLRRMAGLVREWERGDESREAFAARHGLTVSQFAYWTRRVRSTAAPPAFVPLQVVSAPSTPLVGRDDGGTIDLMLPSGEHLSIREGVSATTLQIVLAALRAA